LIHGCLPPVKHRCLGLYPRKLPEIEVTGLVLHILYCPSGHLKPQLKCIVVKIGEIGESVYCLRCTLDINRINPVMVVLGTAAAFKEIVLEISKSPAQIFTIGLILNVFQITLQTIEIITGMEIIYPPGLHSLTIIPGAVRPLTRTTVT